MTTTLVLTLNLFAGAYFLMEKKDLVDIGDQENQWSNDKFSRPSVDLLEKTVALSPAIIKIKQIFLYDRFRCQVLLLCREPQRTQIFLGPQSKRIWR